MECSFQTHVNCDQILSLATDSTGKLLVINLTSVYTVSQNCKHVGMKKSGYTGNNQDRSGSCYMKQFFIPLRRNGKFMYEIRDSVLETMMIATTLRRVWNKHIRKFCILWSFYFKIERRAKCKSQVKCWYFGDRWWLDARLLFRTKMRLLEKDHVLWWLWVAYYLYLLGKCY